jgi:toxin ParE1/3/4
MTGYVLSPRAQADLDTIWDFTGQRWNAMQAERYIRQLWDGIVYVAGDPRRGHACDDIRRGYYKSQAGSHVIFYRVIPTGIDVVRILHGSMDFEQHL